MLTPSYSRDDLTLAIQNYVAVQQRYTELAMEPVKRGANINVEHRMYGVRTPAGKAKALIAKNIVAAGHAVLACGASA